MRLYKPSLAVSTHCCANITIPTLFPHSFPRTYCENLNKQVSGTELAEKSLEEVVVAAWNGGKPLLCFNNAAQASEGSSLWGEGRGGEGGRTNRDHPLGTTVPGSIIVSGFHSIVEWWVMVCLVRNVRFIQPPLLSPPPHQVLNRFCKPLPPGCPVPAVLNLYFKSHPCASGHGSPPSGPPLLTNRHCPLRSTTTPIIP